MLNPDIAGLFEGSFFWGGPPFIFQEEVIQY